MTLILAPRPERKAASFRRNRIPLAVAGLALAAAGLMGAPVAVATPSVDAVNAIDAKYSAFGGAGSLLGTPIAEAVDVGDGAERDYTGGVIYYSKDTGAKVMYGAILDRYKTLGGPTSGLGFPTNDESDAGNGVARFNDFAAPGGASIYWSPEWGATVVKGRVRDAWLASGGINGPFGYPSADTTTTSGVETGKFVGPAGTEIQWSDAAGLVTVPAALASSLPGFRATAPSVEGTTPVPTPTLNAPTTSAPTPTDTGFNKWWWIPIGLAIAGAVGGLLWLLGRRRGTTPDAPAPVVNAATPSRVTATPNGAARSAKAPTIPAPPPPKAAPAPPKPTVPTPPAQKAAPAAPKPVVTSPPAQKAAPAAPKPTIPAPPPPKAAPAVTTPTVPSPPAPTTPALHLVPDVAKEVAPAPVVGAVTETDTGPTIKYETPGAAANLKIEITYENNAVGDDQESTADKSSKHP